MLKMIGVMLSFGVMALADFPSVHGMLFFGKQNIYLSHLPMFHEPHDYQAIFQVEIPPAVKTTYLNESSDAPSKIFTIVPEPFELPKMAKVGNTFKAVLFKGHFERGGEAITGKFLVKISKVIQFNQLDENSAPQERYFGFAFGTSEEMFLAHEITSRPGFDQISQIEPTLAGRKLVAPSDTALTKPVSLPVTPPIHIKKILYTEFEDLK